MSHPKPVRDTLLKVATRQFAAVGYEATTMRGIATAAGVTLPTVYHYFGDKANLYLEVCLACFGPRAERGLATFRRSAARDEQRVLRFFVGLASDLLEDEEFFKLMHREMIDQDRDGIRRLTERCWKGPFVAIAEAVRPLLPAGQDPTTVAFTSFALVLGLAEFRRNAQFLNAGLTKHYTPEGLALLVLATTVPAVNWQAFVEPDRRAASA